MNKIFACASTPIIPVIIATRYKRFLCFSFDGHREETYVIDDIKYDESITI